MGDDTQMHERAARTLKQWCGPLHLDPYAVSRRISYPPDVLQDERRVVAAAAYFAGWDALIAQAKRGRDQSSAGLPRPQFVFPRGSDVDGADTDGGARSGCARHVMAIDPILSRMKRVWKRARGQTHGAVKCQRSKR